MLDMGWNTNTYSDVASLGMCGSSEEDNLMVFAGNLVTSQIIVGDLRARRRTEDLEVATSLPGKAPLTISVSGDVFACACCSDCSILVYRFTRGKSWSPAGKLQHHTDQVTGLGISSDGTKLASCGWDGLVCIWSLGSLS